MHPNTTSDGPEWLVKGGPVRARLGASLVLDCAAAGQPRPRLTWRREAGQLNPAFNHRIRLVENVFCHAALDQIIDFKLIPDL